MSTLKSSPGRNPHRGGPVNMVNSSTGQTNMAGAYISEGGKLKVPDKVKGQSQMVGAEAPRNKRRKPQRLGADPRTWSPNT